MIEFTHDESGYEKARCIISLISLVDLYELNEHFDQTLLNQIRQELTRFLSDAGVSEHDDETLEKIIQNRQAGLKDLLRKLFGPGRQELNLSKQREALIERAEHAENSAFEALAELAEVTQSRDDAINKIKALEAEISALKSE